MSRPDSQTRRRRKPRPSARAWWIGAPLGLVLLVFVLLLVADIFDRRLIADPLTSFVEQRINREVQLDDVDLRWGLPMSLHARQLSLANAAWAGDTPMLRASPASLSLDPIELLNGAPYAQLEIEDPDLVIARSDDGQWNWQLDTGPPEPVKPPSLPVTVEAGGGQIRLAGDDELTIDLQSLSLTTADDAHSLALALDASNGELPLEVDGRLNMQPERYSGEAAVQAGESTFAVNFSIVTNEQPVSVEARINSDLLVPSQLAAFMPADDADEEPTMAMPRLTGVAANVEATVGMLRLQAANVDSVQAALLLNNGELRLELGKARLGDAAIEGHATLDTTAERPALRVEAQLERSALSALPESLPASSWPGEVAARVTARIEMPERRVPLTPAAALSRLAVADSRFVYARPEAEDPAEIVLHLQVPTAGGEPSIEMELQGVEAPPFEAMLSAPPLRRLETQPLRYPLELTLRTAGAEATVAADVGELLREPGFAVDFSVSGDNLPSLPAFGFTPPPMPRFSASGSLQHVRQRWELTDAEIGLGDSRLTGSAVYHRGPERPVLEVDASASLLDIPALRDLTDGGAGKDAASGRDDARLGKTIAEALRTVNADVQLSAGRVQVTEAHALTAAKLDARLRDGHLRVEPLAFDAAGGSLDGTLNATASASSVEGRLVLDAEDLRLDYFGDALAPVQQEFGRLSGELHLTVSEETPDADTNALLLPSLGRLSLDDTRLRFSKEDAATDVTLTLSTEGLDDPDQQQRLRVEGSGSYRGAPVSIELHGGPLVALRNMQQPYDLDVEASIGGVEATLDGQVEQPWSPQSAEFRFSASASQPGLLERLLAPYMEVSLPAFDVDGRLDYAGDQRRLSVSDLDASFGESDVRGNVSLDWSADSPSLSASLQSNQLDVDDLTGRDGESEDGVTESEESDSASGDVLPEKKFDLTMLKKARVNIDYRAGDLDTGSVALGSVTVSITLEDGHLVAQPVRLEAFGGELQLRVNMQTTESALSGIIDAEARGLNLDRMLQREASTSSTFGAVGGQGKIWVAGDSVAALAASADGGLMLLMTGGKLDALLVQLASLDIGEALLAAIGLADPVPIDCGYASLHSNAGIVEVYRFVVDTADTTFFLDGDINLRNETLDLTLYPQSKDAGFPAADAALAITGPLTEPQVNLQAEDLAGLGLGAVALGALAGPTGALLPLVEGGLQDEPSACAGWVERLKKGRNVGP